MQQAFNLFNSGKYKQAYNQLNSTPLNIESYQPNLIVCEYLSNRSIQSSQQCLKKLSQLLAKKNKKDNDNYERLTQQLIKYNIGILLILNGKKENAFTLFNDISINEKCFIDYLKYRIFLLLMELNVCLKSSVKAINLAGKYINNPYENRNGNSQWISTLFHEHSKAYYCISQELGFMVSILLSQAMMQLGVSEGLLYPNEERQKRKEVLLEKARKRKNNINKYYEINLLMIDRFYQAQKQFHLNNIEKAVNLLHFQSIQSQYDQMPQTKIITNIYSSFSNNNIAIINYSKGKKAIALYFLTKAQTLLSKGCTGVQDKDLQLFSSNYANHSFRISFNLGLLALSLKSTQSYTIFESLKKINQQKIDFKYWYRVGQSQLEYYHLSYSRLNFQQKTSILQSSLKSFQNSLISLSKRQTPDLSLSQTFSKNDILKQDQIQTIIIKMNGETQYFKQNIILLICYISLILKRYYKTIALAKQIIKNQKSTQSSKLYSYHYLFESYLKLDRLKEATRFGKQAQKLTKSLKKQKLNTYHQTKNKLINEQMEVENLIVHQNAIIKTKHGQVLQGLSILQKDRSRNKMRNNQSINISHKYLQNKQKLQDNKYT